MFEDIQLKWCYYRSKQIQRYSIFSNNSPVHKLWRAYENKPSRISKLICFFCRKYVAYFSNLLFGYGFKAEWLKLILSLPIQTGTLGQFNLNHIRYKDKLHRKAKKLGITLYKDDDDLIAQIESRLRQRTETFRFYLGMIVSFMTGIFITDRQKIFDTGVWLWEKLRQYILGS